MKIFKLLSLVYLFSHGFVVGQNPPEPKAFQLIDEVVSGWSPDTHVWKSGSLPVAATNLNSLDEWISQTAPNWTVVLMRSASRQQYDSKQGMDAVEFALGEGLSNRTKFGELKDPRTNESNGAVFVLFLDERKFSYFSSDVFDNRGLGESKWIGRLDSEAIRAMRNGGRIIDAVKNTISSIENQLTRAIEREEEAKRRAGIERQKQIEEARLLPAKLDQRINAVQRRSATLRNRNSDFRGQLAYAPDTGWLASVKAVQLYSENGDWGKARAAADSTLKEIDQYEETLNLWETGGREIEKRVERLGSLSMKSEAPEVTGQLSQAKASIRSATDNHNYGDPIYLEQLAVADQSLNQAESRNAVFLAEREAEAQRRAALVQKAKAKKIRDLGVGGGTGVLFLGWLGLLNRRRRKARAEAGELYIQWRKKLRGKFDRLFNLMDRTSVIQRSSGKFAGESASLTAVTVKAVDELFIMSSATDRVMEQVNDLVDPGTPWGKLINTFSVRRYRRGIELMDSKAIGFDKSQGLIAILNSGKKKQARDLLGDEGDYEPFSMSFKQLITAYDTREASATDHLERLERCVDGLPMALEKAGVSMEQLAHQLTKLDGEFQNDGFFPLDHLQETLLPSAEQWFREASELGSYDPVSAMEGPAFLGIRCVTDASNLAATVESARSLIFPVIHRTAGILEGFGLSADWIDNAFHQHSKRAEEISLMAVEQAVSYEVVELGDELICTRGRIQNVAQLATRMTSEVPKSIEVMEAEISRVHHQLVELLKIDPAKILVEDDLNPGDRVSEARTALERVRRALNQGNIESAQEEFQGIERLISESDGLLRVSMTVAEQGMESAKSIRSEIEHLKEKLPSAREKLNEMVSSFPAGVLLFKERFGGTVSGQRSIANSIELSERHLSDAAQLLLAAGKSYGEGKLIAAGGEFERAGDEAGFAKHQLALIEGHFHELKKAETDNRVEFDDLQFRYRASVTRFENQKTTQATIEKRNVFGRNLEKIKVELTALQKNPFRNTHDLKELCREFVDLEEAVKIDWNWHETALKEVKGARKVLDSAEDLISAARNDGITDSRKLEQAIQQHGRLERSLLEWQVYLSSDHRDWEAAYRGAVGIESEATEAKGVMADEIKSANAAARDLQRAANTIAELKNWSDSFQKNVDREAGDSFFYGARQSLAAGDYRSASTSAVAAISNASSALSSAISIARRARADEEAARRRRAAAATAVARSRRSSTSSISRSSSSISSRGSSSRSSSSSGSGFSRSGW